jgi:hypothetical protein
MRLRLLSAGHPSWPHYAAKPFQIIGISHRGRPSQANRVVLRAAAASNLDLAPAKPER